MHTGFIGCFTTFMNVSLAFSSALHMSCPVKCLRLVELQSENVVRMRTAACRGRLNVHFANGRHFQVQVTAVHIAHLQLSRTVEVLDGRTAG